MKTLTIHEASKLWDISERRLTSLCKDGYIKGAVKVGKSWQIPCLAERPASRRYKTSRSLDINALVKPPALSVTDYIKATQDYYYVDKTLFIKAFIDRRPTVALFTRPRRFGKTLLMDMVRVYFEKTTSDTSIYFQDKAIWQCGESYRQHQGKYPVIFLTFKNINWYTWEFAYRSLSNVICNEARRHSELLDSDQLTSYEKQIYQRLYDGTIDELELSESLLNLSLLLHHHHGVAPIIIIDEYDTPIQAGYFNQYYDQIIRFMRNFLSAGLKDNPHLTYGFLTGILRVAKESIFSGLNNIVVDTVLDHNFNAYFGFTHDEVKTMFAYYGLTNKYDEVCHWYDGYHFSDQQLFNPWSLLNYLNNHATPGRYWTNTSSNAIIKEVIDHADQQIVDQLQALINGQTIRSLIHTDVIYPLLDHDPSILYSFLLVTGYLTIIDQTLLPTGELLGEVAIPNLEIFGIFQSEIIKRYLEPLPPTTLIDLETALSSKDPTTVKLLIHSILMRSASYLDTANESFYHGFFLGLCALFSNYYVFSNRESGKGRYDIELKPKNKRYPGILIELKTAKDLTAKQLQKLAESAIEQVNAKAYATEMINDGITTIYKYGVALSGKDVLVVMD